MDENKTIIDIKPFLPDADTSSGNDVVPKKSSEFHSNPILKKCIINNKKTHEKFSLRDLFR
ncbi:MAG: hypothetical protein PHV37_04420 [Candidatus Gastranaerophilales bacterium]|nr:hypothetical protein [Candidatus Gastranaerophilales bacterium]